MMVGSQLSIIVPDIFRSIRSRQSIKFFWLIPKKMKIRTPTKCQLDGFECTFNVDAKVVKPKGPSIDSSLVASFL
jgi:hypothetical protein